MPRNVSDLYWIDGWITGTLSASATSQLLVPTNPERTGLWFTNDSTDILFIRFNLGNVDTQNYSIRLGAYERLILSYPVPTGTIHCRWGSATGSAKWTDIT